MPLTDDPNDPRVVRGGPDKKPVAQHDTYLVLSEAERAKGFVRPVRRTYVHVGEKPKHATRPLTADERADSGCGASTTMGQALAETYARDPKFYGQTYCCQCQKHRPVAEFVWDGTEERVGS